MCVRGERLQQSPGPAPTTAGEPGSGPFIKPTDLDLSNGCSVQEFVLLVLNVKHDTNTMVIKDHLIIALLLKVCSHTVARAAT